MGWTLLLDIVVLLGAALAAGILFGRLKQNAIVGYLLAGILLGPSGLSLVEGGAGIEIIAELGVALLLFTIGLEFSWHRLRQLGAVAAAGGALQVGLTMGLFALLARWAGLATPEALVVGAATALSSTAVVLRVLGDRAELDSLHGRNALGILLLQDIAVVPLVLLVDALGGSSGADPMLAFAWRILEAALLVAGMVLVSRYILPRLLVSAASYRNRDLPILLAFVVFLLATWGSHELGLSPVLGAFVAGMLLAETPFAEMIRADVTPLRAVFVTVFFTSIGMLAEIPSGWVALSALGLALVIIVLKTLVVAGVIVIFRRRPLEALRTGLVLAQIGEFSFVLAELAHRNELIGGDNFQMLLSASLISLLATPYLIALASRLVRPEAGAEALETRIPGDRAGRVLVIGMGPSGRAVVDILEKDQQPFLVLELNPKTVAAYRSEIPIAIGDATQRETLEHAGIRQARALVVTIPDAAAARTIIRQAKLLARDVPVLARVRHHVQAGALLDAGADEIIDEEESVGRQLAERLRAALGSSAQPNEKEKSP